LRFAREISPASRLHGSVPRALAGALLLAIATAAHAVPTVTIGNGPMAHDGSYINAEVLADNLPFNPVTIEATESVIVEEDVDLSFSTSFSEIAVHDLTLKAPTASILGDVVMGGGSVALQATTANLNGMLTSAGELLSSSRLSGTATRVNVLGPGANLGQALIIAAPGATVSVAPGQYRGNYDVARPVTIVGSPGDQLVPGAEPGAPELLGEVPGGTIFTITAVPNVTISGFRIVADVDGDPIDDSLVAIASTAADGLTVSNDSFDGFRLAVSMLFGTGIGVTYNTFADVGGSTLAQLIDATALTSPDIHDNIIVTDAPPYLVDTGPGGTSSIGSASLFHDGIAFQYLAGQFTLSRAAALSGVEAWMAPFGSGGTLDVVVRSDEQGSLGAAIFTKRYTLGDRGGAGWDVFADYAVTLAAGTYWLALEPVAGGGLQYGMAPGASSPLAKYAFFGNDNPGYLEYLPNPALGFRIAGTTMPEFALTVAILGAGSGAVSSAPPGIACAPTCAASFPEGTTVTLSASAAAGSVFAGWSGACGGAGPCAVTMDAARSVGATFQRALGSACSAGPDCGSGVCVDGVCCDRSCAGQCEACDVVGSAGTCVAVAGAPHGSRAPCASDGSACGGACDGSSTSCAYPGALVACRGAACAAGVATLGAVCDGSGACGPAVTFACDPYVCGPTACRTSCAADSDCITGYVCSVGACVPPQNVSVIAVDPASGPESGGTVVTVSGAGFAPGASVAFGGVPASDATVVDTATITATTPPGVAGPSDVTVTNLDGRTGALPGGFTYVAAPRIFAVSPTSGPAAGGTAITLAGANFASGAAVVVGGSAATAVVFVDATTLTAATPAGVAGAADVTVRNPDGQTTTLAGAFTYAGPPPVPATWVPARAMGTSRASHTATLLPSGKVLVTGGFNSTIGQLASAELYDPSTGSWSATGSMLAPREAHTATLLPSGKVLVTGGALFVNSPKRNRGFQVLASAEIYDPATGRWSLAGQMSSLRAYHTATLLPSGKVLVAGGVRTLSPTGAPTTWTATADLYDSGTNTWTSTGAMSTARGAAAAALMTGKVFVVGGFNGSLLVSAESYDPATGAWVPIAPMTFGTTGHTATPLPNGTLLVTGRGFALYDPSTAAWSPPVLMRELRSQHMAVLLSGKVLAAGGTDGTLHLSSAETFDPATFAWSFVSPMISARARAAAVVLPSGDVLASGGFNGSAYVSTAELYGPASGIAVTAVTPASGSKNGGTVVTITGENFLPGATVTFGGASANEVRFVSRSTLTARSPSRPVGSVNVVVTNPGGFSSTLPAGFTYVR
jgi:hypothetical protein